LYFPCNGFYPSFLQEKTKNGAPLFIYSLPSVNGSPISANYSPAVDLPSVLLYLYVKQKQKHHFSPFYPFTTMKTSPYYSYSIGKRFLLALFVLAITTGFFPLATSGQELALAHEPVAKDNAPAVHTKIDLYHYLHQLLHSKE
jgi:hypothetical protein